jgi:UDP-N-acetylglucosamine--N-acetylmuramyl-(pentapeptide) pyrophosphoryl-undecaprenol N-acetylglucosamine transferase
MTRHDKSIFIVGGHLSPALAVIDRLKATDLNIKIYYIGRMHALEGDKALSLEYKTITKYKIKFLPIITGRLQRYISLSFFISLLKIPIGFIQALIYLVKFRPSFVMAFGGYVSFPVCISAYILGIPYAIHEQTSVLGVANRALSHGAKIVFLGKKQTHKLSSNTQSLYTGIPDRFYNPDKADKDIINFGDLKKPLILISGGSLGSRSVNNIIEKVIHVLLSKYRVLHQTGSAENSLDFNNLKKLKETTGELAKNYNLMKDLDYDTFYFVMKSADLIIGRSGANTCHDIEKLGKRCVLIPLPWSGGGEQMENAKTLAQKGLAIVLEQEKLTPDELLDAVDKQVKKGSSHMIPTKVENPTQVIVEKVLEFI